MRLLMRPDDSLGEILSMLRSHYGSHFGLIWVLGLKLRRNDLTYMTMILHIRPARVALD